MDKIEVHNFLRVYEEKIERLELNKESLQSEFIQKSKIIKNLEDEIFKTRFPHESNLSLMDQNKKKIDELSKKNESLEDELKNINSEIDSLKSDKNLHLKKYYENCFNTKLEIQDSIETHIKEMTKIQDSTQEFHDREDVSNLRSELDKMNSKYEKLKAENLKFENEKLEYFKLIEIKLKEAQNNLT